MAEQKLEEKPKLDESIDNKKWTTLKIALELFNKEFKPTEKPARYYYYDKGKKDMTEWVIWMMDQLNKDPNTKFKNGHILT
jgi:hypothetical protein